MAFVRYGKDVKYNIAFGADLLFYFSLEEDGKKKI